MQATDYSTLGAARLHCSDTPAWWQTKYSWMHRAAIMLPFPYADNKTNTLVLKMWWTKVISEVEFLHSGAQKALPSDSFVQISLSVRAVVCELEGCLTLASRLWEWRCSCPTEAVPKSTTFPAKNVHLTWAGVHLTSFSLCYLPVMKEPSATGKVCPMGGQPTSAIALGIVTFPKCYCKHWVCCTS